jgi:hypothetical protein
MQRDRRSDPLTADVRSVLASKIVDRRVRGVTEIRAWRRDTDGESIDMPS